MTEQLDLRGQACPQPVLATKRFLDKKENDSVEALVDDEVCVSNLERLARTLNASCSVQNHGNHFAVQISKNGETLTEHSNSAEKGVQEKQKSGTVIFISKDQLGQGDIEFSQTLLDVFLQSYLEGGHCPQAILLANSGVKLLAQNARSKKVLEDFRERGSEVLACGLCVEYYGLKAEIDAKQITNMFAICEYLNAAEKLIQF